MNRYDLEITHRTSYSYFGTRDHWVNLRALWAATVAQGYANVKLENWGTIPYNADDKGNRAAISVVAEDFRHIAKRIAIKGNLKDGCWLDKDALLKAIEEIAARQIDAQQARDTEYQKATDLAEQERQVRQRIFNRVKGLTRRIEIEKRPYGPDYYSHDLSATVNNNRITYKLNLDDLSWNEVIAIAELLKDSEARGLSPEAQAEAK